MKAELQKLEEVYNLYLEFGKYIGLLGEEYKISNILSVKLNKEKQMVYVEHLGCFSNGEGEYESDEEEFASTLESFLEGADEAVERILSDLDSDYTKVQSGDMTEEQYVNYAGSAHLVKGKIKDILHKLDKIN